MFSDLFIDIFRKKYMYRQITSFYIHYIYYGSSQFYYHSSFLTLQLSLIASTFNQQNANTNTCGSNLKLLNYKQLDRRLGIHSSQNKKKRKSINFSLLFLKTTFIYFKLLEIHIVMLSQRKAIRSIQCQLQLFITNFDL